MLQNDSGTSDINHATTFIKEFKTKALQVDSSSLRRRSQRAVDLQSASYAKLDDCANQGVQAVVQIGVCNLVNFQGQNLNLMWVNQNGLTVEPHYYYDSGCNVDLGILSSSYTMYECGSYSGQAMGVSSIVGSLPDVPIRSSGVVERCNARFVYQYPSTF